MGVKGEKGGAVCDLANKAGSGDWLVFFWFDEEDGWGAKDGDRC